MSDKVERQSFLIRIRFKNYHKMTPEEAAELVANCIYDATGCPLNAEVEAEWEEEDGKLSA